MFEALCVPQSRRKSIITMAHDDSHFNGKRTKERIITSGLYWPTVASDTDKYVSECTQCQMRARAMCWDRIPAQGMSRDPQVFGTIYWDVAGPLEPV